MYNFPIALQLYSVRTDMETDFEGTLKKVRALGYDGVEFAGLFGHSAEEIKKICAETGLTPISAHVPYADLLKGDETFKTYSD
ncbi:MAG: sugar phosphate isomerase/epimerase, partial [Acutalibacteraceae bacterium]|nr:sugar phosphate isomerase/epimerase [Acutalibacteraceae bacterium]